MVLGDPFALRRVFQNLITNAAGVVTRELQIENRGNGGDNEETLSVDASGTLTSTSITRFGGMHHHHS